MPLKEHLVRLGCIGAITFGTSALAPACSEARPSTQQKQESPLNQGLNLGLNIDEKGFLKAAAAGPRLGLLTETWDKNKMDCLKSVGNFCLAEASPSFKVAINKPMADFMLGQSGLFNPSLPTRMIFTEEWLDIINNEQVGGYAAISDDGFDQIIVISLKAAALRAFMSLDAKDPDLESALNGSMSLNTSYIVAHEWAHAGMQTKKLLKPGMKSIPDDVVDATHPQIHAFSDRYLSLYKSTFEKGLGEGALIFETGLEKGVNVLNYRSKILEEAAKLGIIK